LTAKVSGPAAAPVVFRRNFVQDGKLVAEQQTVDVRSGRAPLVERLLGGPRQPCHATRIPPAGPIDRQDIAGLAVP
jgi:hypothetical protein